jgi:hypothetical protein
MARAFTLSVLFIPGVAALVAARPARSGDAVDLAGHSSEDVEALRKVRDFLAGFASDESERSDERREAIWALQRVHEALGDWGSDGQVDWYVALIPGEKDDRTQEALAFGGEAAARGSDHHLGGVRDFWREVESRFKKEGKEPGERLGRVRREFEQTVEHFTRARSVAPRERHLRLEDLRREREKGRERRERERRRSERERPSPDTSAPTSPAGLEAKEVGYRRIELAWRPSEDPETGIGFYRLYRNDEEVATLGDGKTGYVDKGLEENTRHVYKIVAYNRIGLGSPPSDSLSVTTKVDKVKPEIKAVSAAGDPGTLVVAFSEPMDPAAARDPSRYRIDGGVKVASVSLSEDEKAVTLGVSPLSKGVRYTLSVDGLVDQARARNRLDSTRTAFEYVETGDGLLGVYYRAQREFKGRHVRRLDGTVDFDWGGGKPHPEIDDDNFTIRWKGKVRPEHTETYTFYTDTDDGARLWVGGKKLVDAWETYAHERNGRIDLVAGTLYDIVFEFHEDGGGAYARLKWSSPSTPKEVIPQKNLYSMGAE